MSQLAWLLVLGRLNPDGSPRVSVTLPPTLLLLALQPLGGVKATACTAPSALARLPGSWRPARVVVDTGTSASVPVDDAIVSPAAVRAVMLRLVGSPVPPGPLGSNGRSTNRVPTMASPTLCPFTPVFVLPVLRPSLSISFQVSPFSNTGLS